VNQVAAAFLAACQAEIEAPKPGNVHVFAGGHDMEARHFLESAEAAAEPLTAKGASVGSRVFGAIKASMAVAGTNTNLGIVLLCAPLVQAFEKLVFPTPYGEGLRVGVASGSEPAKTFNRRMRGEAPRPCPSPQGVGESEKLQQTLESTLESLDVNDSVQVFAAIRLANPGGMGKVGDSDLSATPLKPLRAIMAEAQARDRIAKAYADGYRDIFGFGLDTLAELPEGANEPWWPATAVYLTFLSSFPDTHIVRKWGPEAAEWVRSEAEKLRYRLLTSEHRRLPILLNFDRAIKARGLNPGTSADLTVTTLFAKSLINILQRSAESG
jgi:triphosphoribosyl-dephospho-CoA synthase